MPLPGVSPAPPGRGSGQGLGCGPAAPAWGSTDGRGREPAGPTEGHPGVLRLGPGSQPPRIQWAPSRARPARWGREEGEGRQSPGLADQGDGSAGRGSLHRGRSRYSGRGGETEGEVKGKRPAAPLISTRWLSPPGRATGTGRGEGRGVLSGSAATAARVPGPAPFPVWN